MGREDDSTVAEADLKVGKGDSVAGKGEEVGKGDLAAVEADSLAGKGDSSTTEAGSVVREADSANSGCRCSHTWERANLSHAGEPIWLAHTSKDFLAMARELARQSKPSA